MPTRFRNSIVVTLLAALAVGSWWQARSGDAVDSPPAATRMPPEGYYLRDSVLLGTDANGQVAYRVHAGRIQQRETDRQLLFDDVRIDYRDEDSRWQVSAASAVADPDRSLFELSDGIRLDRLNEDGTSGATIETQSLSLMPEDYLAVSDRLVKVRIGDSALSGVGLRADLKADTLELESDVHGEFLP